ncbi:MAG TPA: hypothetical protein PK771_11700 [Spirochaetota bacterium]|nr:hypothetical protein [Spirochaetota bacterium]
MVYLDAYLLNDSILEKKFSTFFIDIESHVNFYELEKIKEIPDSEKKKSELIFIEEDDSYINTVDIYDKILSIYENKPAIIILSNNTDVYNVVRWMRKGASDYLLKKLLTKEILTNSINGSLEFIKKDIKIPEITLNNPDFETGRVSLPTNFDWNNIVDNKSYEMSLVMITINIEKELGSRFSKSSIEKLYEIIKNEITLISSKFGGKIWVSQNNFFILSFYFGDYINSSVLFGLYFFNRFFLLCVEKLKLDEIIDVKLSIHSGNCLYHKTNTEQITSDVINSLVHLENLFNDFGNLLISETVYSKLSNRLLKYFENIGNFENKQIYKYVEK